MLGNSPENTIAELLINVLRIVLIAGLVFMATRRLPDKRTVVVVGVVASVASFALGFLVDPLADWIYLQFLRPRA